MYLPINAEKGVMGSHRSQRPVEEPAIKCHWPCMSVRTQGWNRNENNFFNLTYKYKRTGSRSKVSKRVKFKPFQWLSTVQRGRKWYLRPLKPLWLTPKHPNIGFYSQFDHMPSSSSSSSSLVDPVEPQQKHRSGSEAWFDFCSDYHSIRQAVIVK